MEQVGIRTGGHQAAHQTVFKHVAGPAGVLADDDPGRLIKTGTAFQLAVVPAQETANLKGMVSGQIYIGFSAEAIGSKIFTHREGSFLAAGGGM